MPGVRNTLAPLASMVLAATLAGCGGSSSGGAGAGSAPTTVASGTATVTIQGFAFHPSTLTVTSGTKVTFVQQDAVPHDVSGQGGATFVNSPALNKGQSYTVTFTKAGTYNYICSIHPRMQGKVVVQ
jgi:amicyanin